MTKLAEALLRRKELQGKLSGLGTLKKEHIYEVIAKRVSVTDNVDDLVLSVPKLDAGQVLEEFNYYARQLRLIDAAIQQANWTTDIVVSDADVMTDYKA